MGGGQLDGAAGRIGAPLRDRALLADLSMRLADIGEMSSHLWSTLIGLWVHQLLFRRELLCVLDTAFTIPHGTRGMCGTSSAHFVRPERRAELTSKAKKTPYLETTHLSKGFEAY